MGELWVQRAWRDGGEMAREPRYTGLIHHASEQSREFADEGVLTDCNRYMRGRNSHGDLILSDDKPFDARLGEFCMRCLAVESAGEARLR